MKRHAGVAGAAMLVLGTSLGVVGLPADATAPSAYEVTIARDATGVPHITATDWGSLAFGQGYALSQGAGEWRPFLLTDDDVAAAGLEATIVTADRSES